MGRDGGGDPDLSLASVWMSDCVAPGDELCGDASLDPPPSLGLVSKQLPSKSGPISKFKQIYQVNVVNTFLGTPPVHTHIGLTPKVPLILVHSHVI